MAGFSSKNENKILYNKDTVKRLVQDIKTIKKFPLDSQGIYYKHDEDNILKGYALIKGPEGTPYSYGNYFFDFDFPGDYPHTPPKVTFYNYGDNIRYNPNLYRSGKVCLSILNTWRGEGWTSCQTLTTVLLTLCTVLNENPLTNEPGITMQQATSVENYNRIIGFKNIEHAILGCVIDLEKLPDKYSAFFEIVKKTFDEDKNKIKELIKKYKGLRSTIATSHYNMQVTINYPILTSKFKSAISENN